MSGWNLCKAFIFPVVAVIAALLLFAGMFVPWVKNRDDDSQFKRSWHSVWRAHRCTNQNEDCYSHLQPSIAYCREAIDTYRALQAIMLISIILLLVWAFAFACFYCLRHDLDHTIVCAGFILSYILIWCLIAAIIITMIAKYRTDMCNPDEESERGIFHANRLKLWWGFGMWCAALAILTLGLCGLCCGLALFPCNKRTPRNEPMDDAPSWTRSTFDLCGPKPEGRSSGMNPADVSVDSRSASTMLR